MAEVSSEKLRLILVAGESQRRYLEEKLEREIARSEALAAEVLHWQARYESIMKAATNRAALERLPPMLVCAICAAKVGGPSNG